MLARFAQESVEAGWGSSVSEGPSRGDAEGVAAESSGPQSRGQTGMQTSQQMPECRGGIS